MTLQRLKAKSNVSLKLFNDIQQNLIDLLSLSAFSLHIAIASSIACNFAFVISKMLVALLYLTSSCVNITFVSIPDSSSATFFQDCDASLYIIMLFVFLIILFNSL